ncbi:MAG: threonine--tRNA ligase [Planctomycetes bacterium]|nr:threonine--tRNA ligase [Planctomycetota bacterium]
MARVKLPDGSIREFTDGVTVAEVAAAIGPRLAQAAIFADVDGAPADLSRKLAGDVALKIHTDSAAEGVDVMRHSTAHILAEAVMRLFPGTKLGIGPTIEDGFYYDFEVARPFTPDDLPVIEKEMEKIIAEKKRFERVDLSKEEARKAMAAAGQSFKVELIDELPGDSVSFYRQGEWTDLCRGPHLPETGRVGCFKLLRTSAAYWRGDQAKASLQRIYGTAFAKKKDLEEYLRRIEEAEKRDHRRIGKDLDLYSVHEEAGAGLIYWHPKGALVRYLVEEFWRQEHLKNGYDLLFSPHIARAHLWETSGHLGFYKENMYSPITVDEKEFYLKPMNCPFHILMYKNRLRAYRELPFRWAELGTVYRYEKPGVLHGLLRVRGFTQDDAHIFCRPDQVEAEICRVLKFVLHMLRTFGFKEYEVYLATRPKEKSVGRPEDWAMAEEALRRALAKENLAFGVDEGGGAFYGPKIDLKIKDCIGRSWQCSTVQFDFNLPERFALEYVGDDGKTHRPYMIHRALLGSIERFFGVLIEHYGGAFPLWLAPVQAAVLPISDPHVAYAEEVRDRLRAAGFRVELDARNERVNHKIREWQLQKAPYMLVVGEREAAQKTVAVRERTGEQSTLGLDALLEKMHPRLRERV